MTTRSRMTIIAITTRSSISVKFLFISVPFLNVCKKHSTGLLNISFPSYHISFSCFSLNRCSAIPNDSSAHSGAGVQTALLQQAYVQKIRVSHGMLFVIIVWPISQNTPVVVLNYTANYERKQYSMIWILCKKMQNNIEKTVIPLIFRKISI